MARKDGRASWFKVFLHQKSLIDAAPDADVGQALKAALQYFEDKTIPNLDPLPMVVFATLKEHIDESFADYQKSVDGGKAGGDKRWKNAASNSDSPPIPPCSPPIGVFTDADADAEADRKIKQDAEEKRALSADFAKSTAGIDAREGNQKEETDFNDRRNQQIQRLLDYKT